MTPRAIEALFTERDKSGRPYKVFTSMPEYLDMMDLLTAAGVSYTSKVDGGRYTRRGLEPMTYTVTLI